VVDTVVDPLSYAAFLAAAVIIIVVPGPDMLFIVAAATRGGPAAGLMATAGTAVGLTVHTAAAVCGLSALFGAIPALAGLLRWGGAAYLLYLAARAFRAGASVSGEDPPAATIQGAGRSRAFWQAIAVDLCNPKTIVFFVAFLPQFVTPRLGHVGLQLVVLGATFVLTDLVIDGAIGLVAGRFAQTIRRGRRIGRGLDLLAGTVFIGLAVRVATAEP
jgi:threonine/homoserine/homoserine lactone efflux protein